MYLNTTLVNVKQCIYILCLIIKLYLNTTLVNVKQRYESGACSMD